MKNKFGINTEKGQSLLEITITVGIAALVISAIAITTIIGLKNSEFSQNQIQATKLAQEGLEKVRSMRDNNSKVCVGGSGYNWRVDKDDPSTSQLWLKFSAPDGEDVYLNNSASAPGDCYLTSASPMDEKNISNKFSRKLNIKDTGSFQQEEQITSTVIWIDSSGTHQSYLVTILSAYQN